MNRRPSFADRIRQIRATRQLEEAAKLTQPILEAEAAKAADLARLDKIVDNSSDKNRNFFIAYLGLLIYVQAIIFSTSDLKLLLPNQELKLPLIDLGVPLVGFYFTIPIFVIALHFNFLQNLESHHYKLMRWQQAHPNGTVPRSRLNPFLFDFAILETSSGFRSWVLWANNILCYNLAPITLALLLFRYSDRQDFPVTLWHYIAFVVDSYLVWRLRKALLANEKPEVFILKHYWKLSGMPSHYCILRRFPKKLFEAKNEKSNSYLFLRLRWALQHFCKVLFANEKSEVVNLRHYRKIDKKPLHYCIILKKSPKKRLEEKKKISKINLFNILGLEIRRLIIRLWKRLRSYIVHFWEFFRGSLAYRPHGIVGLIVLLELVLSFLIAGTDDATFNRHVLSWAKPLSDMNSRPVEWVLPRIKIEPTETVWQADDKALKIEAELAGATNWVRYFNEQGKGFRPDPTSLRLVSLSRQKMPRAQFSKYSLQGADLSDAQMEMADLKEAQLQVANLNGAQMQSAEFQWAQMQGANLEEAKMERADLNHVQMQGVDLSMVVMTGANLDNAQMQGAILDWTQMLIIDLNKAQMQGAILSSAFMQGALLDTDIPVYGKNSTELFADRDRVIDWAEIEERANLLLISTKIQDYLNRIKQVKKSNQISLAFDKLHYEPRAIANSALSAICNSEVFLNIQRKETLLASAQAFRNSYINMVEDLKQNPDYPKILLDIDYQLCTLDVCKDIRDGIEGLDCKKALQNPPK